MSQRKVIISPFNIGALQAAGDALNMIEGQPKFDIHTLFFSCMIQAGIESFESRWEALRPLNSEFLLTRSSELPSEIYVKSIDIVEKVFNSYLYNQADRDSTDVLKYFLVELLIAVTRNSSLVTILPIPQIEKYEKVLPPQLYYSIKNMLGIIKPESADLPLPIDVISREQVFRFQEIIKSDLFVHYSMEHQNLEDITLPKTKVYQRIEVVGRKILRQEHNLLRLEKLMLSVIPVTSKLIDTIFGKLPGILADSFGEHLTRWLNNKKRIVIYRFDPLIHEIILNRLGFDQHSKTKQN